MGMDGEVEAARPSDALTKLSTEELAISSRLDFLPVLPLGLPDDLDEPCCASLSKFFLLPLVPPESSESSPLSLLAL